jgi:hypothetical protein
VDAKKMTEITGWNRNLPRRGRKEDWKAGFSCDSAGSAL